MSVSFLFNYYIKLMTKIIFSWKFYSFFPTVGFLKEFRSSGKLQGKITLKRKKKKKWTKTQNPRTCVFINNTDDGRSLTPPAIFTVSIRLCTRFVSAIMWLSMCIYICVYNSRKVSILQKSLLEVSIYRHLAADFFTITF